MGRQGDRQGDLMVTWSEMPRSPGHVFYDRLQEVLVGAGFDGFVEDACQAYYARTMGRPPCRRAGTFACTWRVLRGDRQRARDRMALLGLAVLARVPPLGAAERVPDHSWLSKTRGRLPHEVHETVFGWVLALIAERGPVRASGSGSTLRPWRPMPPCGRSCAVTPARATARC